MINMKIVKYKIDDLLGAEYNPRELTQEQYQSLRTSIQKYGIVDPILINTNPDRQNVIIGGHQRVKVAKILEMESVPCIELNLSLEEEKELNIRLNKNVGQWDYEILGNMFDQDDLLEWGFTKFDLKLDTESVPPPDLTENVNEIFEVVVECKSEKEQEKAFESLSGEGYTCRLLTF